MLIKCTLFLFLSTVAQALNATDCHRHGEARWLCDYMHRHKREYQSLKELGARKAMLQRVRDRPPHPTVRFGMTSRSDRFPKELRRNVALKFEEHRFVKRPLTRKHVHLAAPPHLPPIDWRNVYGVPYVTSVKDQGECGGCFAFASSTVLEYWSRKAGYPKSLSPQALLDCTSGKHRPDDYCDGGLMEYVFEYAKKHPVPLEQDVPYLEMASKCPSRLWSNVRVKDYKVLMISENPKAESEIEWLLHAYGPISVGVDSTMMDHYHKGIFTADMCSTDIDHAVTIVGYTKEAWIIKNSWGPDWGDKGYLYLERGKNACGVAEYIVYITDAEPIHKSLKTRWTYFS